MYLYTLLANIKGCVSIGGLELTRVALPIEIVLWIAMTFQVQPGLFACRAVRERGMVVSDVVEKVDFVHFQHQRCGDGVNRSVSPPLVKETAFLVEKVEVVRISRGA